MSVGSQAPDDALTCRATCDLSQYRARETERLRSADLLRVVPKVHRTVLDVGARDGYFSMLLRNYFQEVTALDLDAPTIDHPRIRTVAGDVTRLAFEDGAFDVVFCTEVLEHISRLQEACRELSRLGKHALVIGVPYEQDLRIGRTTCGTCGAVNPPWGHVNTFTREKLFALFPEWRPASVSFVGENRERTNSVAAWLMNLGCNPWGTYSQQEKCVRCRHTLRPPNGTRPAWRRACSAAALCLERAQTGFARPRPIWMHAVFTRAEAKG